MCIYIHTCIYAHMHIHTHTSGISPAKHSPSWELRAGKGLQIVSLPGSPSFQMGLTGVWLVATCGPGPTTIYLPLPSLFLNDTTSQLCCLTHDKWYL